MKAYNLAWRNRITGVPRHHIEQIAPEPADTAHKTHGRSMIILGAGVKPLVPHGYELPGMINMLVCPAAASDKAAAAGRTMSVAENCVRRPVGCRWRLPPTGAARRAR